MPHPLPPFRRIGTPRTTALTAGALLAGATLLLTPRAAHATDDVLYQACLDAVHGLALDCLESAESLLGDLACMWAGGVGYITCAVIEAIRQLLPGGLNAT